MVANGQKEKVRQLLRKYKKKWAVMANAHGGNLDVQAFAKC